MTDRNARVVEWSPRAFPHVVGRYNARRVGEDGMPEPQRIVVHCTLCETTWQGDCTSGRPREKIAKFAVVHAHRDLLAAPRVVSPNTQREQERDKRR